MKLIRNLSLMLAGVILLLHMILPHEHHSELDAAEHITQHETAKSLFDYFKLAFHMDQGEGHLEKYQASSTSQLSFHATLLESFTPDFELVFLEEIKTASSTEQNLLSSWHFTSQIRFRGPPHRV